MSAFCRRVPPTRLRGSRLRNRYLDSDFAQELQDPTRCFDMFLTIQTTPAIHAGLWESRLRERDADGFITVAFLGLNGLKKAITLIPEIVRQLLGIHNSAPVDCPVISQQLRALARENPRVAFIEKPGDQFHLAGSRRSLRSHSTSLRTESISPERFRCGDRGC